jgi:hypothetical protein
MNRGSKEAKRRGKTRRQEDETTRRRSLRWDERTRDVGREEDVGCEGVGVRQGNVEARLEVREVDWHEFLVVHI